MAGENLQINSSIKNFFPELVLQNYADKRVYNWPFMKNPHIVNGLVAFYFLAIFVILPWYMRNKKPYELKTFIKCYNIFQVVACSIIIHETLALEWTGWDSLGCKPIVYTTDKLGMRTAGLFWWTMLIKACELIETIVFALRKKTNQISGLHLYHHISSLYVAWISTKYAAGGMLVFTIFLNSCVHVLMYSYYFLASFGPEMQKKLTFIKSKLTIIQLIQLIILFVHTLQVFSPNCDVHIMFPIVYLPILTMNIILFLKFYQKTYVNKKSN